jgi:HlyD family secretion protein
MTSKSFSQVSICKFADTFMSIKKAIIILIILAVVGGGITYGLIVKNQKKVSYQTETIKRGKLIQTVSETGTVKGIEEVELSFARGGTVKAVYVDVGDKVKKGELLAELDCRTLLTSRNEAKANLDLAQSKLNKLLAGATKEEIAVARANAEKARVAYEAAKSELVKIKNTTAENVAQAEKTLADLKSDSADTLTATEQAVISAQTNLENTKATYQRSVDNYIDSALTTIEDKMAAANTALDTIDRTLNDEDAEDYLSIKNLNYLYQTKRDYKEALDLLADAQAKLATAENDSNNGNVLISLVKALETLDKTFTALENCYKALENSITSSSFTQTELDTLKSNISAQQTIIATAISAVQTAKHNLDDAILTYNTNVAAAENALAEAQAAYGDAVTAAENALTSAKLAAEQQATTAQSKVDTALEAWRVAQANLNKILAPPNTHDIALARAQVRQAEAALAKVNDQLADCQLTAPIAGVITQSNYDPGEQASISSPAFSLLGDTRFEIEVLISEADIAKVKVGDRVEITLDAFGEEVVFPGQVYFIDPAQTEVQDVIYYKTKVNFKPGSRDVKAGMTANVTIFTAEKNNVLIIPTRAIVEKNNEGKLARVLVGNKIILKPVKLGLRGDGGRTELLSGLSEGTVVVTYIKKEK